jgi:hypothetical protein
MLNATVNGYTGEVKLEVVPPVVQPILPDFEVVRIDETKDCHGFEKYGIKKVYGVYLYDKNCETRCCSFQKDHYLRFVDFAYETIDYLTEEQGEKAYDFLMTANRETEDGFYMAVSAVERIAEEDRHEMNIFSDKERLEASENRDDYDDLFNATMEHYLGNPIW